MPRQLFTGVFGTLLGVLALWPVVALTDPLPPAVLQTVAPVTYQRRAADADPRGGPVYLTAQDFVVTARVQGVYQVVALITGGGMLDYARAAGRTRPAG